MQEISIAIDIQTEYLSIKSYFPDKKIIALVGDSGSGKTTLLKSIAGLSPYTGTITFVKNKTDKQHENTTFVFSHPILLPHLSVLDNLYISRLQTQRYTDVENAFDITPLFAKMVQQLSNGEKQRICLARAFLTKAKFLLLDEVFHVFDNQSKKKYIKNVIELCKKYKMQCINVSHNWQEVLSFCDYLIMLDNGTIYVEGDITTIFPFYKGENADYEYFVFDLPVTKLSDRYIRIDLDSHKYTIKYTKESDVYRLILHANNIVLSFLNNATSAEIIHPIIIDEIVQSTNAVQVYFIFNSKKIFCYVDNTFAKQIYKKMSMYINIFLTT